LTTASRRSLGDGPATLWPPTPSPMAAQYPRLLDSNRVIPGFATSYANGPTVMSIPNATATHFTEATSASAGMMTSGALAQAPATATAATAKRQQYANAPPPLGSTPATQVVWVPMQVPMQAAPTTQGTIIQPATMPAGNASSWVAAGQLIQVSTGLPVSQDSNMQVDDEPLPPPSAQQKAQIASYAGRQLFSEALEGKVLDHNTLKVELPSPGSALHGTGRCNPCAWFWKPKACQNGANCQYCHLCPEGELKARKKAKVQAIRMGAIEPAPRTAVGVAVAPAALKLTSLI